MEIKRQTQHDLIRDIFNLFEIMMESCAEQWISLLPFKFIAFHPHLIWHSVGNLLNVDWVPTFEKRKDAHT